MLARPKRGCAAALKTLWLPTCREAQVQGFADAYLLVAACFAAAVVPLMRKVAPRPPAPDGH